MLLTVAMGVLVYRAAGPPTEQRSPIGLPFVAATPEPTPTLTAPGAEDCQVEPRPLESLRRLNEEAAKLRAEGLTDVTLTARPAGTPAGASIAAKINQIHRQLVACSLAGNERRATALFSDNSLIRSIAEFGPFSETELLESATPRPIETSELLPIFTAIPVEDVIILPDGRVGAPSPPQHLDGFDHAPLVEEFLL